MSTTPQLVFQIRPEAYATLTLEAFQSLTPQASNAGILLTDPPIPQPVLDADQLGNPSDVAELLSTTRSARFSRPWLQWFWLLKRFLSQSSVSNDLSILAPSVDETDDQWFGTGTIGASTDPVTFNATLTGLTRFGVQVNGGTGYTNGDALTVASSNGQGRPAKGTAVVVAGVIVGFTLTVQGYNLRAPLVVTGGTGTNATATLGRQWAVGDFILWNDPTIVSGAFSYEIDQITGITAIDDTHFTCTLARHADGAATGFAQYGSKLNAHASANFYRLINKEFFSTLDVAAGPQLLRFLWDNMCVAALQISGAGASLLQNLAPPINATRYTPPSPGLRTMSGAAYISLRVDGQLVPGANTNKADAGQAWETVRAAYAKVDTAPVGASSYTGPNGTTDANAALIVYLCWVTLAGVARLIDILVIDSGQFTSFASTNAPDGRQMPYLGFSNKAVQWPPNMLPLCTSAFDANGNLTATMGFTWTDLAPFSPDGYIQAVVVQTGLTASGANLRVVLQT